jgi:hypothetical protein
MATGALKEIACDTVLLSMVIARALDFVEELRRCAPETGVAIVGDCGSRQPSPSRQPGFPGLLHI